MRAVPLYLLGLLFVTVPASDVPAPSEAAREGELIKQLVFSGELQALQETLINTPNIGRLWVYPIAYLAPEGVPVKPGDLLAAFDRHALEYRTLETEKAREDARLALARKQTQLEIRRQDTMIRLAESEKNVDNARLWAGLDPQLISRSDAEKYRYELERAEVELEKVRRQLESQEEAGLAELEVEKLALERARLDLGQMLANLDKMQIYAQTPGIPLYALGSGRKIQVGDNVYKGSSVLRIPDMERLKVSVSVYDQEFPALRVGQPARVVLDAVPERAFAAEVIRIPEAATVPRVRFGTPADTRVFQVDLLLLETDPEIMKPGMSARVELPVVAGRGLLVPRSRLWLGDDGETVVRPAGSGRPVPVRVLDCNRYEALVEGELNAGTELEAPSRAAGRGRDQLVWHTVTREDLRFTVTGNGTLEAARSDEIGPPVVPNVWNFKIKRMVPEGTPVKAGDVVALLDAVEVHNTLRDELAALEKVRQEAEKTEASLKLQVGTLELQLEEARVAAEKAENKLAKAQLFDSFLEIETARNEARFARRKVELLEKKLTLTREGVALELAVLADRQALHQQLADSARDTLPRLELRAPRDGIVIYAKNWNNEKKQVGGDINLYERLIFLPDLESLLVAGQVSELDAGKLRPGQEVEISLDALPEETFAGRIVEISQIFTQASPDRPLKVAEVKVELDELDTARMRPGMVARLRVTIDHFEDALTVPLHMLEIDEGRTFVWLERNGEPVRTAVRLGRDNGVLALVEDGLREGDRILTHPPRGETAESSWP